MERGRLRRCPGPATRQQPVADATADSRPLRPDGDIPDRADDLRVVVRRRIAAGGDTESARRRPGLPGHGLGAADHARPDHLAVLEPDGTGDHGPRALFDAAARLRLCGAPAAPAPVRDGGRDLRGFLPLHQAPRRATQDGAQARDHHRVRGAGRRHSRHAAGGVAQPDDLVNRPWRVRDLAPARLAVPHVASRSRRPAAARPRDCARNRHLWPLDRVVLVAEHPGHERRPDPAG